MLDKTGRPGLIVSIWYYSLHRDTAPWTSSLFRKKRPALLQERKKITDSIEMIYHDLIPPELYDEVAKDVIRLENEYQHHWNK